MPQERRSFNPLQFLRRFRSQQPAPTVAMEDTVSPEVVEASAVSEQPVISGLPAASDADKHRRGRSQRYLERFKQEYPSFASRLADKPLLAGCSYNPFQSPDSADARATRIAMQYVEYFTKELESYGYRPFMGTEINFQAIGTRVSFDADMVRALRHIYKTLSAHVRAHYPNQKTPHINRKLATEDSFYGRIYSDVSEPEVTTPPLSPAAMIRRVHDFQRALYESTQEYAREYNRSDEGLRNETDKVPCGPSADALVTMLGQFNINYAHKEEGPTGQHISISLLKTDGPDRDYSRAKLDNYRFGAANIMKDERWRQLFTEAYEAFLPNDELMAFGHPKKFELTTARAHQSNTITHHIRENSDQHDCTHRLKIHSFNDGSSNIALSTLAILSITYATIKALHEMPELLNKMQDTKEPLTDDDIRAVLKALSEHARPIGEIPYNVSRAREYFNDNSLTLFMMRSFVHDTVNDPEQRSAMLDQISEFRAAVHKRSKEINIAYGR